MPTPHEILGVSRSATQEEIKRAFRQKAKTCHPDVRPDKIQAEKEFKALNAAYEALKSGKYTGSASYDQWTRTSRARGKYDWSEGAGYKEDPPTKKKSREHPVVELGVEPIKIVIFNVSGPSYAEKDMDAWDRIVYFAKMPFEEDVFLHVVRTNSVTVKIPKGTVTGQRFKFKHPDYPNTWLTIRCIHDKFKGL